LSGQGCSAAIVLARPLCGPGGVFGKEDNHDGKRISRFFFIVDPEGYKVEVLQRGGRYL
jgi:hypothetical protein